MGYTPGFEGPHPSELPNGWEDRETCGHNGLMDNWRGDEITPPGYVWSCLYKCGRQVFYPDDPEGTEGAPLDDRYAPDAAARLASLPDATVTLSGTIEPLPEDRRDD